MDKLGIYVHIPFCKKKCKYCDFISFSYGEEIIEKYFEALIDEIEKRNFENMEKKEISTIYFGGGTPSFVDSKYIVQTLDKIKNKFQISKYAEITIEVNPGTISKEKILDYKNAGINRISIGLQSTHNRLLDLIGRVHNYQEFLNAYNLIREIGFDNVNIDLMLGLPTQTLDELKISLNEIISLKPAHISLYSLILEENTEMERLVTEGIVELPDEEMERKMYWETKKILEDNDYIHYEISNFSKNGMESKHNLECWNQGEYIGFGLAAHSYLNNKRFSNITDVDKYIDNIKTLNIDKNIILQEKQTYEEKKKEFMMIGLRKIQGISISEFERKFRINPLFYFRFEISKLTEMELIEVDLDNIKLTKKGLDYANIVFQEFI